MVTIKSYTDLQQSKKLAKILPLGSADMFYTSLNRDYPWIWIDKHLMEVEDIPCWSLAALLNVLPDGTDVVKDKSDTENEKYMCTVGVTNDIISTFGNNPVDACVDMILKLKRSNLL